MPSPILADATDLAQWANRVEAQADLPRLLRRLVHATVNRIVRVNVRAGEGIVFGGWDAGLVVETGNQFVPDGISGWELTTRADTATKANRDYAKRTGNPGEFDPRETTFVFLTPRRWGGKDDWAAAKNAEGHWRAVRAYDADDLEHWLEVAPTVHIWISQVIGKHPDGVTDLESFWLDWSAGTQPPITTSFLLAGRDDTRSSLRQWLQSPSSSFAFQADSRDEAIALLGAVVAQLDAEARVAALARSVIVFKPSAWQQLVAVSTPLILVQAFDDPEAITQAMQRGHHVVVPLGQSETPSRESHIVKRLDPRVAAEELIRAGVGEERAHTLASNARLSLQSFRRRYGLRPELRQPPWARPENARVPLPALLAGSWTERQADRTALATLASRSYEDLVEGLIPWVRAEDPVLKRLGETWRLISKEDSWFLLASYLTDDNLIRFKQVVLDVLTFACRWLEQGGSLAALQEILGHSTIVVTQRYARLGETHVRAEAERVRGREQTGNAQVAQFRKSLSNQARL